MTRLRTGSARLLPLLLLLALPATVHAGGGGGDSTEFTYVVIDGAITITGDTNIPVNGMVTIPSTILVNNVSLPVTSIGDNAFYGYSTALRSITIPDSVTNIGVEAFYNCDGLTNVTIGNGVTSITEEAFTDCVELSSLTIGNGVTSIGYDAFYNCWDLQGVTIPDSVTNISDQAFVNCYKLTFLTLGSNVTGIGDDAFADDTSLTSVAIPASVTSIGEDTFVSCASMTAITVDPLNPAYSSSNGVVLDKGQTTIVEYPGGITGAYTIPTNIMSIGNGAFADCISLTGVTIPNGVITIEDGAFAGCTGLTSVTIPNSVFSIGLWAFLSCSNLTNVTIGTGLFSLGGPGVFGAFESCPRLTAVYFQGNAPTPTDDVSVFSGDTNGIVYYLPGATGWGTNFDGLPTMLNLIGSIVGSVTEIVGNVTVTHPDGSNGTLQPGGSIEMGDTITTLAGGEVNIQFLDNTLLAIPQNGSFTVNDWFLDVCNG